MASHSGPSLPSSYSRKRKWNSKNVTKIDLGDSDSDSGRVTTSTAVVSQVTRDGRRIERTLHSIPVPRDPPTAVESHDYVGPDNADFLMDIADEDFSMADDDVNAAGHVCPDSLPQARVEAYNTTGRPIEGLERRPRHGPPRDGQA